jgi:DNA-binding Lrp family transcriptional regulator
MDPLDAFIVEHYPLVSTKKIAEMFGVSPDTVRYRRNKIFKDKAELIDHILKKFSRVEEELTEWEKGYLGGIIDGEGTITFEHRNKSTPVGYRATIPFIRIVNTEESIAVASYRMLSKIKGVKVYMYSLSYREGRKWYEVVVLGVKSVFRVLLVISSYLMSERKRKIADLVKRYCEMRIARFFTEGKRGRAISEEELNIVKTVHELNKRGGGHEKDHITED